ncbi:pyridoxal phosphate-dependent aminotransferase [Aurantibacter aestuarii]|uniref:Aminotransferase n=1 Tax=Aurantibacter aestuarii TaxID=1266046 RepID=A0A2T1NEA6_9FLAO|nr:aminotransferase class I/II-fold pyridoxal phosphate-dependent enzyme [Aurantibacter aestuarii]PSG90785.1 aminotransferase [Aurantibacter aestuarii]
MIEVADRLQEVQEYYFSKKLKEVAQLKAEGKPIINLGIGSPDLPPNPLVVQAMVYSLNDEKAHQYQSYVGLPKLREAIAQFYKKHFSVEVNPETETLPLMGSKEGILHISMAFLNKGDQVLIPNPGYPTYASVSKLVEAEAVFYNLNLDNHWFPDLEALEKQDLSKVKLMWINYPNMPTGANATKDHLEKLVQFALKHNILLVNDNPYSFILNENKISLLSIERSKDCCLELNSLSKTFNLSGWRVGFVLGKASFVNAILRVKSNMDSGMFYGIQKGAIAALSAPTDWLEVLNEIYKKRRELVWQIANKLNCRYTKESSGLFVWAKLPEGKTSEAFTDDLLYNKSVFVTPGTIFGSQGEGYIRFSLCANEADLQETLNRL